MGWQPCRCRCPGMKREAGQHAEHVWNMGEAFSGAVKFAAVRATPGGAFTSRQAV
jgi:hypothetical protein